MFWLAMFRQFGWKGLVIAIFFGIVLRVGFSMFVYHNITTALLHTQHSPSQRAAFLAGLQSGGREDNEPSNDTAALPAAPEAPASAWVSFAENDANTGARIYHAKLTADMNAADAANANAPNFTSRIEFQQAAHRDGLARLTLARIKPEDCTGVTKIDARFDNAASRFFDATPHMQDSVCAVDIKDFVRFRDAVLNAQTLRVVPASDAGRLGATSWHVSGLAWDVN